MRDSPMWLRATGQTIDRLCTIDPRRTGYAAEPNLVRKLYDAALDDEGTALTYAAADALVDAVGPLDTVLILTGAGGPPWFPAGETDGPPGAVGLAHALSLALEARPVIATEDRSMEPVVSASRAAGLAEVPYDILQQRDTAVSVVPYPAGRDVAERVAEEVLGTYEPSAVIAVEKMGPNDEGVITQEVEMTDTAWVEPLVTKASARDILTIGVGDRGNEIGFGTIEPAVREIFAHSERFEDIACRVKTDHLVVGGVSNWGAYGIGAMLALLSETPEALHGPEQESKVLDAVAMAGATDAISHRPEPSVDGTSETSQRAIVGLLNDLVRNRLTQHEPDHLQPLQE